MTSFARQYLNKFGAKTKGIESFAVQRNKNTVRGITYYIFSDGSAIFHNSEGEIGVVTKYGLHPDYENL